MGPPLPVAGAGMGTSESPNCTVFCSMSVTPTLLPAGEIVDGDVVIGLVVGVRRRW